MAWGQIAAALAPSIMGALAGQGANQSDSTQSVYRNLGQANPWETGAGQGTFDAFQQMQQFTSMGPGMADIQGGYQAQNDLASMLKSYSQGGYAPTAQDQRYAQAMTAPQAEAIRQSGIQQQQQFRQIAAQTGRGPMDFAFQNKLGQNLANMQQGLAAQQSQIAAQQPGQRLSYAQDYASLKQGLASQAMANRQAIAGLGASIRDSERNLRIAGASTTSTGMQQQGTQQSNMLQGALAGIGTGLSAYNQFGGGATATTAPSGSTAGALGVNTNLLQSLNRNSGATVAPNMFSNQGVPPMLARPESVWGQGSPPQFSQGSSLYGTQNLGAGLPQFMQPAFNAYNPINTGPWK